MRGPNDQPDNTSAAPAQAAGGARPRPPGGKALYRQLQLLESAGYVELARQKLETAVSPQIREQVLAAARQFSALPTPTQPPAAEQPPDAGQPLEFEAQGGRAAGEANVEGIGQLYHQASSGLGSFRPGRPTWRSLGPWTVPNGQTYGSSRVNVSGRVAAIAIDPTDLAHILVGAANGGVWESRDQGASWSPRSDYAPTLATGALVFDPNDPNTVYCGTGEGNWWSWLGQGILRSTDGGTTWSPLCFYPFVGMGFYDLRVDPANSQRLVAATTGGLFTSADGGHTWTMRRSMRTWTVSIAANGTGTEMLAACMDGLWQSLDGGETWQPAALPIPASPPAEHLVNAGQPAGGGGGGGGGGGMFFSRLAVAIAPSNSATAYAWGADGNGAPYLWQRSGGNWATIPTPGQVNTAQSWYDWFLAVSPADETQIYIGAIDAFRGDHLADTWNWTDITSKDTGDSIHPDQHAIAFAPGHPEMIYVGNDGGLFFSPDCGDTWQNLNHGLVISEFEYIALHPGSSRWLIGGTQDNGTERWTGTQIWDHVADGDGGDCAVNRADPNTVFHTYYNITPERSTTSGDFGSWTWIAPLVPPGEGNLFYPPFEASATSGSTIATGGSALYVSRDNGSSWTRILLGQQGVASALTIPNADTVYVGLTSGQIFKTQWAGLGWIVPVELTAPRPDAYVSDLYVDPENPGRMWATYRTIGGGRVFRSDEGGSSWSDRSAGLPGLPINAVEVDNTNPQRVWVAADLGVYESRDGGSTWDSFSNGLPNAYVGDLAFHPHARVLCAGTRNRGVWEIPVDGWLAEPVCGVQYRGRLSGGQSGRIFTYHWPASWHVDWTVMPTNPRPGSPQVTWDVQVQRADGEYATYWITVRNLSPDSVEFELRYSIFSFY